MERPEETQEPVAGAVTTDATSHSRASRVLANIPDVDEPTPVSTAPAAAKRLLSQKASRRLLIAGGVMVFLIAVVAFLARKPEIEGDKVLHPEADVAKGWDASAESTETHVLSPSIATPPAAELNLSFDIPGMEIPSPDMSTGAAQEVSPVNAVPAPTWNPAKTASPSPSDAPAYTGQYQPGSAAPGYGQQYQPPQPVQPPASVPAIPKAAPQPTIPQGVQVTDPQANCGYPVSQPIAQDGCRQDARTHAAYPAPTYTQTQPVPPVPSQYTPPAHQTAQPYAPAQPQPYTAQPQTAPAQYTASRPAYTAPNTQYAAPSTQYTAPSTQYTAPAPTAPTYQTPDARYPSNISYPPTPAYSAPNPGGARLDGTILNPSVGTYGR